MEQLKISYSEEELIFSPSSLSEDAISIDTTNSESVFPSENSSPSLQDRCILLPSQLKRSYKQ
jgi:hypothetical protein